MLKSRQSCSEIKYFPCHLSLGSCFNFVLKLIIHMLYSCCKPLLPLMKKDDSLAIN